MKILLDTNIIIHREANKIYRSDIGQLFNWIDKLKHDKYIHPLTIEELNRYKDENALQTLNIKIESYNIIKHPAPESERINELSKVVDVNGNDINDTKILNEIFTDRLDILISEDKKIHKKAELLDLSKRIFKIQDFLEKVIAENPELVDYDILAVKKVDFAEVDIKDSFFDSFRIDYAEFNKWFNRKANDPCYVCYSDHNLTAFLFIKIENEEENYSEIIPNFLKKKRLKIGTLKVTNNGYKIGERFLKTIFDNAIRYKVEEIYVTIFSNRPEQDQLIEMLLEWGFVYHGIKTTTNGKENVYVRPFGKNNPINIINPKLTFPFFSWKTNKYIIKIEPAYHTELFPDSINTKEDKSKYTENEPHRNRISKVYISHSQDRHLQSGDIIIVYRMGETSPKKYSSTITTICIVENVINNFNSFDEFLNACNRKTMISKENLKSQWWDKNLKSRPFVVNFLYAHSLPTPKPTLDDLNKIGVIPDILNMPRGFIQINDEQFNSLVNFAYRRK